MSDGIQAGPPTPHRYRVADGRCHACGCQLPLWTPAEIVRALRVEADRLGRPPRQQEWETAGYGRPAAVTVRTVFGSWNAALDAAELPVRQRTWSRQECIHALFLWRYQHGRVPRQKDWRSQAEDRPSMWTIRNRFGAWNAFLEAAGYPVQKQWSRKQAAA